MTDAGPAAGHWRATLRERLLRLAVTLYILPFLLAGILAGFALCGRIADVWPWRGDGAWWALVAVCAPIVPVCICLAGWIAWVLMLAILLPLMHRRPAWFAGFVLVGNAPAPWYGWPIRRIGDAALRRWPLPGAGGGPPARL